MQAPTPNTTQLESPYLTADEAAAYLRFPTTRWFYKSVKKYGIPCVKRGSRIFFIKTQLDEFMSVASEATNPKRTRRKRAH